MKVNAILLAFLLVITTVHSNQIQGLNEDSESSNQDDFPPPTGFAKTLWDDNFETINKIYNSSYIQSIKNGTLDPNIYSYIYVQDLYYLNQATLDWSIAASRAQEPELRILMKARYESYKRTVDGAKKIITVNPDSIFISNVTKTYVDWEADVAKFEEVIYTLVVMLPCSRLWVYLADRLNKEPSITMSLYYFWIKDNISSRGFQKIETYINDNLKKFNKTLALEIYKKSIALELDFFNQVPNK